MMFNIMKKKDNEKYCYIGKNRTEISEQYMAVKLTKHDADEYAEVLSKDGGNYIVVEAK